MNKETTHWYARAYKGDIVRPVGLWNRTTGNKFWYLPEFVTILDVSRDMKCESGIAFKVKLMGGSEMWMDANWFRSKDDYKPEYEVRGPKGERLPMQGVPVHETPDSAAGPDEGSTGGVREGEDVL